MITWAYGITTVTQRLHLNLQDTLRSLNTAGFSKPRLFVDGHEYQPVGLDVSVRKTKMGAFGNWVLALWELWIREPNADRYAIFQDDILAVTNLRSYLDRCNFPEKGYWNLYTFPYGTPSNLLTQPEQTGWHVSNQKGRGALGLVFDRDGVSTLLQQPEFVNHPRAAVRANARIDGTVMDAMTIAGYREYIHNPSLLQHTGNESAIRDFVQPIADTFPGEEFDAATLLSRGVSV